MTLLVNSAHNDTLHTLYSDHHGWLQGWLRRKLGCTHQAADLAHDAFIKLLVKPEVSNPREPRALLTTIARRLLIDHWRREDVERTWLDMLAQMPEVHAPSAESRHIILEFLTQIASMLDGLKPKVCTAFLMSQLDGMPHAQIAHEMQVSQRTVERYVAEALYHCYTLRYAHESDE